MYKEMYLKYMSKAYLEIYDWGGIGDMRYFFNSKAMRGRGIKVKASLRSSSIV